MIAIDTNVLVRFLLKDDPAQTPIVMSLFRSLTPESPGFVSREVTVELSWVLERAMRLKRPVIFDALTGLMESDALIFEDADRLAMALNAYRSSRAGLADHLIRAAAEAAGCSTLVTFDRDLAEADGVRLLTVPT